MKKGGLTMFLFVAASEYIHALPYCNKSARFGGHTYGSSMGATLTVAATMAAEASTVNDVINGSGIERGGTGSIDGSCINSGFIKGSSIDGISAGGIDGNSCHYVRRGDG